MRWGGTRSNGRKRIFPPKIYMGSSVVGVKGDEPNDATNQVLGGHTPRVNGQNQIVRSGNYCNSFFYVDLYREE